MTTSYFQKFPTISYQFAGTSSLQSIINILHRGKILDYIDQNVYVHDNYYVRDGDTIWTVANGYYGDPRYAYLVMLSNPTMMDPYFDWPLSYQQFTAFMESAYGSLQYTKSIIHHYEDQDGDTVDATQTNAKPVYLYDYLYGQNEDRRNIKLIQKQYTSQIDNELNIILQTTGDN